jgi:hypothetical protein
MTEVVGDFIDITYEILSSILPNATADAAAYNTTKLELIKDVLANEGLLVALANRTGLTAEKINLTFDSIYYNADCIQNFYNFFSSLDPYPTDRPVGTTIQTYVFHIAKFNVYFLQATLICIC